MDQLDREMSEVTSEGFRLGLGLKEGMETRMMPEDKDVWYSQLDGIDIF